MRALPVVLGAGAAAALACSASADPPRRLDRFWRDFFARPEVSESALSDRSAGQRVALGKMLFADVRLSGPGTRACASCHQPTRAFADGLRQPQALDGASLPRNTPALWNLAWSQLYSWDGRTGSLEAQSRAPIEHPGEMAGDWPGILSRLAADPAITAAFEAAFPSSAPAVTAENVLGALAAYARSIVSPATRFDRWVAGEEAALSREELAGFRLFVGRAGCVGCHAGWRFTDDRFHDIGLPGADEGRGRVPGGVPGLKAFRTPGLREAAHTAPYMHDGSLATLEDVVAHYAGGFQDRPGVASGLVRGLELTAEERAHIVAFVRALSSEPAPSKD